MTKLKFLLRSNPVFFLLLPLFFVLHGFVENFNAIPIRDAVLLWLMYSVAALLIFIVGWLLYRNRLKAALLAFCLMAFNFFFGAMHDFLKKKFDEAFVTRYPFLLLFFFIAFIVLIIALKKMKRPSAGISLYLNSLLIILVLIDCLWLLTKSFQNVAAFSTSTPINCNNCAKPDIFLLVFDEYSSSSSLKESWNYDNSDLDSFLIKKRFRLLPGSRSNYNFTQFSMASTLNMGYLEIPNPRSCVVKDYNRCAELIRNNSVCSMLHSLGYQIVNNSIFDLNQNPSPVSETFLPLKTKLITSQTFLNRVKRDLYHLLLVGKFEIKWLSKDVIYSSYRNNQKLIQATLQAAADTAPTPKFVYSHIEMPHPPFYFQGDKWEENKQKLLQQGNHPDIKSYLNYLPKTNGVLKEIVNKIIDNAKNPVAIILLGDHGFRSAQQEAFCFRNLNAVYTSSGNYSGFYDSITNVNEFKALFNNLFNSNLPLLKDSTIFLRDKK